MNAAEAYEEFFALLVTCLRAVFMFALLCMPGLSGGFTGMLPQSFLSVAAKLQMNMLLPCLILANVGRRFDLEHLDHLWPLLAWSLAQNVAGLAAACALFWCVGSVKARWTQNGKPTQPFSAILRWVVPGVSSLQNCVGFGLPLLETLCQSGLSATSTPDECFEEATLYLFTYMVTWQLFLWTVMYGILQSVVSRTGYCNGFDAGGIDKVEEHAHSLEDGGVIGKSQLASDELGIAEGDTPAPLEKLDAQSQVEPHSIATSKTWDCGLGRLRMLFMSMFRGFRNIMNPALAALVLAVMIAMSPRAKSFLFVATGFGRPFGDAVQKLGNSTPVVATIVMSASLGRAVRAMFRSKHGSARTRASLVPRWAGALLVATRLFIIPCIGLGAMCLVELYFGTTSSPSINSTMRAVILLELASPAANNCIVLCQKLNLPDLAEDLATTYVPMYLLCLISVPAYLSIGLYIF